MTPPSLERRRTSVRIIPARPTLWLLAAGAAGVLAALLSGTAVTTAGWIATAFVAVVVIATVADYVASLQAWRRSAAQLKRRLPAAFAVGVSRSIELSVAVEGTSKWRCELYDHADSTLITRGLPMMLGLAGGKAVASAYSAVPTHRGEIQFAPADIRVRSQLGLCDMYERIGATEMRRVYPDFAQVARYAWLAGDRRLQEIGVKTYQQRGRGTDFKQLSEYRTGDTVRHIDWRATLRMGKPIVREYQDERDQNVLLLVDCGRRMRADDRQGGIGTTHFDQVLNAVMLLSYVALKQGDAVGAMTFGTPDEEARSFEPRKGTQALNGMMSELYAVQPTPTHSDYVAAAQNLLRTHRKRSLVIIITNFRDEDSAELSQALKLLRSRHLVLLASLRERIVDELMSQRLTSGDAAIDVAGAHLYEQARRDAFNRLAARDALMIDAAPERLGVELVNRYHAMKRAGTI